MTRGIFTLDLNESFPRLARPPIVEAAIHWQARSRNLLDQEMLRKRLSESLPEYPVREPIHHVDMMATVDAQDGEDSSVVKHRRGLQGLRLKSNDGRYVIQLTRDGLVFSRVRDYEHWETFLQAARDAWRAYSEIAEPLETQRLGVRFINQIAQATPHSLQDYLHDPPTCPWDLPLKEFVYQSTFDVPGHPFNVRVIKVLQPLSAGLKASAGLLLDIDVFSTTPIPDEPDSMDSALKQMRWLKNKVFFTLLTAQAVEAFGGGSS